MQSFTVTITPATEALPRRLPRQFRGNLFLQSVQVKGSTGATIRVLFPWLANRHVDVESGFPYLTLLAGSNTAYCPHLQLGHVDISTAFWGVDVRQDDGANYESMSLTFSVLP